MRYIPRKVESSVRVCPGGKILTRPNPYGPRVRSALPMRVHRRPARITRIARIWRNGSKSIPHDIVRRG
ncbi:hypothetical protein V7O67_05300 [Methanolobus sp. ZRKC4]|uniref:hypothetical protein n=1 Tax=Methanolobus sp. ZRKC4 TaxID=3125787 RepID=UPI0032472EB6